jgi:hypothetical protein
MLKPRFSPPTPPSKVDLDVGNYVVTMDMLNIAQIEKGIDV